MNDNETLNWFLNKDSKKYFTYNYGLEGSGPHVSLARMASTEFNRGILQPKGHYIFIFLQAHIQRVNGFMNQLLWLWQTPCYHLLDNGQLKRDGSFQTCQPWRTKLLMEIDKLIIGTRWYRNFPKVTQKHIDKTCLMLAQLQTEFFKKYPESNFSILYHPHNDDTYKNQLINCFARKKIDYLYFPNFFAGKNNEDYNIPYDFHPSAKMNEALAKEILSSIETESK